jgi:hypothetical protein
MLIVVVVVVVVEEGMEIALQMVAVMRRCVDRRCRMMIRVLWWHQLRLLLQLQLLKL